MTMPVTTPCQTAVFNTNFLPYSQTFVYEQLVNHVRYEAEVFCWRTENLDWFPFPNVHRANLAYGATRRSPAFFKRFREKQFDLVHAHFATGAVYALPYVKRAKLPFVVTFHGYDVPPPKSRPTRAFIRQTRPSTSEAFAMCRLGSMALARSR